MSPFLKFNIMNQQNTDHESTTGLKLTDSPDICQAAVLCCHFPPLVANIVANYRRDIKKQAVPKLQAEERGLKCNWTTFKVYVISKGMSALRWEWGRISILLGDTVSAAFCIFPVVSWVCCFLLNGWKQRESLHMSSFWLFFFPPFI